MSFLKREISILALTVAIAGVTLAGCNQAGPSAANTAANSASAAPLNALPLTDAQAMAVTYAPAAQALPPAAPLRVAHLRDPGQRYAYAERAYAVSHAFADAPPDYEFDYQGVRPWVWHASDRSTRLVEPINGGDRDYYYDPGAEDPYLVRDGDYAYGYDQGELVVVYDREGRVLGPQYIDERTDIAARYLARARALHAASVRQRHEAVARANWAQRRAAIDAEHQRWEEQQQRDADWRAYHDSQLQAERDHYAQDRVQRTVQAAAVAVILGDRVAEQHDRQEADRARAWADHRGQPQPPQGYAPGRPYDQPGSRQGIDGQAQRQQAAQADQQRAADAARFQQQQQQQQQLALQQRTAALQAQQAQQRAAEAARNQQMQQQQGAQQQRAFDQRRHDQEAAAQQQQAAQRQQAAQQQAVQQHALDQRRHEQDQAAQAQRAQQAGDAQRRAQFEQQRAAHDAAAHQQQQAAAQQQQQVQQRQAQLVQQQNAMRAQQQQAAQAQQAQQHQAEAAQQQAARQQAAAHAQQQAAQAQAAQAQTAAKAAQDKAAHDAEVARQQAAAHAAHPKGKHDDQPAARHDEGNVGNQ